MMVISFEDANINHDGLTMFPVLLSIQSNVNYTALKHCFQLYDIIYTLNAKSTI